MNTCTIHDLAQGTPPWHTFRTTHFGASEAAAMLGLSPYTSRAELLKAKALGTEKEVGAQLQAVFDRGHETEALARPIIEEIIGEELYPATCSMGHLSASCDGLTMDGLLAFEHKQFSANLFEAVKRGTLPEEHQPQCQQVMLVTGAKELMFVCSDGTNEHLAHLTVRPDKVWQDRILAGWAQFEADLAAYQYVEAAPPIAVAAPEDLPTLTVELVGQVTATNLVPWKAAVLARIQAINTDLKSDEDFAVAEKTVKFLGDGEKRLDLVKSQALAQTISIDELFRTIDALAAEMRAKRLNLDKLVKARKESIKAEILADARRILDDHAAQLNRRCRGFLKPMPDDLAGAARGLKTVASLRDAVADEVARCKILANEAADKIQLNLVELQGLAPGLEYLFSDLASLVGKEPDDFVAAVKLRLAEYREAEAKRTTAAAKTASEGEALRPPLVVVPASRHTYPSAETISALRDSIYAAVRGMDEMELRITLEFIHQHGLVTV